MAKCSECGYLALRNMETRELDEAEESFRRSGKIRRVIKAYASKYADKGTMLHEQVLSHRIHEELPLCFVGKVDLRQIFDIVNFEDRVINTPSIDEDAVKDVITKERECKAFTKWHQGFTPKEHKEMLDRKWERKWRWIEIGIIIVVTALVNYLIWLLTGYS